MSRDLAFMLLGVAIGLALALSVPAVVTSVAKRKGASDG